MFLFRRCSDCLQPDIIWNLLAVVVATLLTPQCVWAGTPRDLSPDLARLPWTPPAFLLPLPIEQHPLCLIEGVALFNAGDYRQAEAVLRPCQTVHADCVLAALCLSLALLANNLPEQALLVLEDLERRRPDDPELSWYCSLALAKSGRSEEAVQRLKALASQSNIWGVAARRLTQGAGAIWSLTRTFIPAKEMPELLPVTNR